MTLAQAVVLVRPATVDDAAAVCALVRRSIVELGTLDHAGQPAALEQWLAGKTERAVADWIAAANGLSWIALRGGRVVGYAQAAAGGCLRRLYVAPHAARAGVGTVLLDTFEAQARRAGWRQLRLHASASALVFYQARGYLMDERSVATNAAREGWPLVKRLHVGDT
jgi:GNAT superfamily N-acetyltransferase